jgi:hypothetical protein
MGGNLGFDTCFESASKDDPFNACDRSFKELTHAPITA